MNAQKDGLPMPRRLLAICAVSFGQALCIMDGSVANIVLPTIASDLHVDNAAAVLVITVYQLVLLMALLPLSALGDKIGHNRLYRLGLLLFSVATALCFIAHNLPVLLVIRALQALGAAAVLSVSMAIVKAIYPAHQLGRGLALNTIVGASAGALAPTLGGFILGFAPWPFVFAVGAPLGIVSLLLDKALPPSEPKGGSYDLGGALLCAAMFGLTIVGVEYANQGGAWRIAAAVVAAGLVVGFFFVRRERGRARPLMPVDLLARPDLALSLTGAALIYMGFTVLIVVLPFQLQQGHGFTSIEVGTLMASMPIASFFIGPFAGLLSDRFRPDRLALFGSLLAVVAALALAHLPAEAGRIDILWRLVLLGVGVSFFTGPNTRLFIGAVPGDRTAAASGLIATTRLMGQTLGATTATLLLAIGLRDPGVTQMTVAGLFLAAGASCLWRPTTRRSEPRWRRKDAGEGQVGAVHR